MSDPRCCRPAPRRGLDVLGSVVPAALLALLPKCPACIAAYLAAGAGIGITMTAAAYLRGAVVIACLASLAAVAARIALRRLRPVS